MKSPCCDFLIAVDADGVKRCAKYGCLKVISVVNPKPFIEPKEVVKEEEFEYVIGEDRAELG